jgi:hypothetical protein
VSARPASTSTIGRPAEGDVLISPSLTAPDKYDLRTVPGPPQLVVASRHVAAAWASEFAKRRAVDAWSTDDDRAFVLIVRHRAAQAVSAS